MEVIILCHDSYAGIKTWSLAKEPRIFFEVGVDKFRGLLSAKLDNFSDLINGQPPFLLDYLTQPQSTVQLHAIRRNENQ